MRSASGSTASRVCMDLLVDGTEFLARRSECLMNAFRRRAAWYIVDRKDVFQLHEIVKIISEVRIDVPQLIKRKILQFALFIERKAYRFPDLLMGNTERNTLAREISGRGKCVHMAR